MTSSPARGSLRASFKNALLAVMATAGLLYYADFVHSERAQQKYMLRHRCAVVYKGAGHLFYRCQLPRPSGNLSGADLERLALHVERERGAQKKKSVGQGAATDE